MRPVERVSVIDDVAEQLKDLILSGEIAVGDKFLTEKEISASLRVGRSTVREALRILTAMGFIEIRPGKGAFVAKKKEDDLFALSTWFRRHQPELTDYMEVRMAVEPLALRLAIQRASTEEVADIAAIHDSFVTAVAAQDTIKMAIYDEHFHSAIVKASHNRLLVAINESVTDLLSEYRARAFAVTGNAAHAVDPHARILQ